MQSITPPSISAFAGQEFLRSSYFLAQFAPTKRGFISPELQRDIGMLCESVEFPGITAVTTSDLMAGLNRIKVPYSKDYPDVTLTLLNSVNYDMYYRFINWIRYATSESWINGNSTTVPYFDEFVSNFTLYQFNNDVQSNERFGGLSKLLSNIDKLNARLLNSENLFNTTRVGQSFVSNFNAVSRDTAPRRVSYAIEFFNAYPNSVQSIQSNWADDGFQRLTVSFTYEYYMIRPMDESEITVSVVSE